MTEYARGLCPFSYLIFRRCARGGTERQRPWVLLERPTLPAQVLCSWVDYTTAIDIWSIGCIFAEVSVSYGTCRV